MSASLGLYRLQQVDRQIDRARSQLDEIRKTLENDVELREALSRVDIAQKEHHHTHHELKTTEADVQSQQVKIQQAESSLYGGNVHNPKELQDLQNDVASLKRHLATLEERELESMLKVEGVENQLKDANADLVNLQSRLGGQHNQLFEKQASLIKDLERLNEEREAAVNPIDNRLLEMYDGLRQQRRGVAVAEISDHACAACGATLRASLQQNARSATQLFHCPSCGRILFAD
jgi:uncharacterized protein